MDWSQMRNTYLFCYSKGGGGRRGKGHKFLGILVNLWHYVVKIVCSDISGKPGCQPAKTYWGTYVKVILTCYKKICDYLATFCILHFIFQLWMWMPFEWYFYLACNCRCILERMTLVLLLLLQQLLLLLCHAQGTRLEYRKGLHMRLLVKDHIPKKVKLREHDLVFLL